MEYTFFLRFQLRDKAAIYSEVKTMHFFLRKICMKKRLESAFVYLCIYLFIYLFMHLFLFIYALFMRVLGCQLVCYFNRKTMEIIMNNDFDNFCPKVR